MNSLAGLLVESKIVTCLELYIIENMKELLKQLRCEAPTQNIDVLENDSSQYATRWNSKQLFMSKYNWTIVKKKSLENSLRKAHNWLKYMNLSPKNLTRWTKIIWEK